MNILVSADKFKDSLSAEAVCETIAQEISQLHPHYHLHCCPLTDGGDGFAPILTTASNGLLAGEEVADPLGRVTQASFGIVPIDRIPKAALLRLKLPEDTPQDASIAIVEMAAASGLHLLQGMERDPWQTDTSGTGELIYAAQRAGAAAIVLGVGGSATNDLGLGALSALGYRFLDAQGNTITRSCPANWHRIERIEGKLPESLPPLRIACDVTNPLLGPQGAAAVYAPQKGLLKKDLKKLEQEAERIAKLLCKHHGHAIEPLANHRGAGAAGGIAFGLMCAAKAQQVEIVSGFDLVADWLQLHTRVQQADIVITGEGHFDSSSLNGKGPGALVKAALQQGKPVHVFAGKADCPPATGLYLHPITPEDMPLEEALAGASVLLRRAVAKAFQTDAAR